MQNSDLTFTIGGPMVILGVGDFLLMWGVDWWYVSCWVGWVVGLAWL